MLTEIRCDRFRTRTIGFHRGLNVVLGDENATNSIGKSTLLMVIDFAFGGSQLLEHNKDLAQELGNHDYYFTFQFGDETYRFRRGIANADVVYGCDEDYEAGEPIEIEEYHAFLKAAYDIRIEDISFRTLVGLFFRVWGKPNLDVHRPLHIVPNMAARDCVNNLIKMFGEYGAVKRLTENLRKKEEQRNALRSAFKNDIVPKIGKLEYQANEARIAEIEGEINDIKTDLAKYATNIAEVVNREMIELKVAKDSLLATRLDVEGQLVRIRRNLRENKHIKSRHFAGLVNYFPDIDQDRLASVEEFHSGVAKLLGTELREAEKELQDQLKRVTEEVASIDSRMASTLSSVKQPTKIVDRVYDLANSLRNAKFENEQFRTDQEIRGAIERLAERLSTEKKKVLEEIELSINDGLRSLVTSVFGPDHKSPTIELGENNYSYEVFEDTGTGTAYASLIVLDLTIFQETALPFVAHDTLLFKNIENDSVANLFDVYLRMDKQSFVAIDEISKYGTKTARALKAKSVVQLDNDHVLYVKDWRQRGAN